MGLLAFGPIVVHALVERRFREVFLHRGTAIAAVVFLLVTVPWHARMLAVYGDEFRHYYFWQTQLSFLTGTTHSDPWSTSVILRKIAETWWPWLLPFAIAVVMSVPSLWRSAKPVEGRIGDRTWLRFLWIWAGLTLLVFHLVYVKRDRYVLPVYPAFAMLVAWWCCRWRAARAAVVVIAFGAGIFALLSPDWPRVVDFDRYGDRTGALVSVIDSGQESPVLVYASPDDYCFDCDNIAFHTPSKVQPYSARRLEAWLVEGPVRVYGLRRVFETDQYEVPAGVEFVPLYVDGRAAVFEARLAPGSSPRRLIWPEPTSTWPGAWGFEVRRRAASLDGEKSSSH
jgi:hypothetical protein